MFEFNKNIQDKQPSEKNFGIVFAIIFLAFGLYPIINNLQIHLWLLVLSLTFILLAYFSPKLLVIPNKLWFKFGLFLGAFIAPIVMAFVYVIAVLPVGLIMRLLGKDLLNQKLNKNTKSYWVERDQPIGSMKNQF